MRRTRGRWRRWAERWHEVIVFVGVIATLGMVAMLTWLVLMS